jgi:hypothetical protein
MRLIHSQRLVVNEKESLCHPLAVGSALHEQAPVDRCRLLPLNWTMSGVYGGRSGRISSRPSHGPLQTRLGSKQPDATAGENPAWRLQCRSMDARRVVAPRGACVGCGTGIATLKEKNTAAGTLQGTLPGGQIT